MIIVDTNLVSHLFIPGEHTSLAQDILRKDQDWHTSVLWRFEFRSVLVQHVKKGFMGLAKSCIVMEKAQMFFKDKELLAPGELVIESSLASGCSSYDCEFIVLARIHGVPLVTFDQKILRNFPEIAVSAVNFLGQRR